MTDTVASSAELDADTAKYLRKRGIDLSAADDRAPAAPASDDDDSPKLTSPLKAVLFGAAVVFTAVGALAFWLMFKTVTGALQPHFPEGWAWVVPACTEGGYAGLTAVGYVFERIRKPMWALRPISFVLAAASLLINMAAGHGDAVGVAGHAVPVIMFVTIVELCRHAVRKHSRPASDERVQWSLMKPRSAFNVWRSMRVHRLPYRIALAREDARLYVVSLLRSLKGRLWRHRVPRLLRDQVHSGRLPAMVIAAVDAAVADGSDTAWEAEVHAYIVRELARAKQLQRQLHRRLRDTDDGTGDSSNRDTARGSDGGTDESSNRDTARGSDGGTDESSNRDSPDRTDRDTDSHTDRDTKGGTRRHGRGVSDKQLMPAVRRHAAAYARLHDGKVIPAKVLVEKLLATEAVRIARSPRAATLIAAWQAEQKAKERPAAQPGTHQGAHLVSLSPKDTGTPDAAATG